MDITLTWPLLRKVAAVERCAGQADILIRNTRADDLDKLSEKNRVGCTAADYRIDGGTQSDEEIQGWIKTRNAGQLDDVLQKQASGYYHVLYELYKHHQSMAVTENNIRTMHGYLMKHCSEDARYGNDIVATDELAGLLNREKDMLRSGEIPALVIAGSFVYEYLAIRPFSEGNEKMARLITAWLLLKYGFSFIRYVSLEREFEKRIRDHNELLGQPSPDPGSSQHEQWLIFFLDSLEHTCGRLPQAIPQARVTSPDIDLNHREQAVLALMQNAGMLQVGDIAETLEINIHTLKKDLANLVSSGFLKRKGRGKGTYYFMK